jgi:hypothetical protein
MPTELFRSTEDAGAVELPPDLAATLEALQRATRDFTRRLDQGSREIQQSRAAATEAIAATTPAESEVAAYTRDAKRRADALIASMIAAVEREAADMRREAAEAARDQQGRAAADARELVESARRVADRIVAERQQRIAALSEGITSRAIALTGGMDDAAQVRAQFESFVGALSATASRIATDATGATSATAEQREPPRVTPLAA